MRVEIVVSFPTLGPSENPDWRMGRYRRLSLSSSRPRVGVAGTWTAQGARPSGPIRLSGRPVQTRGWPSRDIIPRSAPRCVAVPSLATRAWRPGGVWGRDKHPNGLMSQHGSAPDPREGRGDLGGRAACGLRSGTGESGPDFKGGSVPSEARTRISDSGASGGPEIGDWPGS